MKFLCDCDTVIRDQTDYLPYKARFIADQDFEDLNQLLCAQVEQVVARVQQATAGDADAAQAEVEAAIKQARDAVYDATFKYAARKMYQCPNCGRLYLEDNSGDLQLQVFVPADDEVPKTMLRSIEGDRWKRPIYGEWYSEPWSPRYPQGRLETHLFVIGPAGVVEDTEYIYTWEALEARDYEVYERMRDEGTLRSV